MRVREQYLADQAKLGLIPSYKDKVSADPAQLAANNKAEEMMGREKTRREEKELAEMYGPGAWLCEKCGTKMTAQRDCCTDYLNIKGKSTKCDGTHATTWGGYVHAPSRFNRRCQVLPAATPKKETLFDPIGCDS